MKLIKRLIFCLITFSILTSCKQASEKNNSNKTDTNKTEIRKFVPNEEFLTKHSDSCGCSSQFELKDSLNLTHIKNQFYKSKTGHLYERTIGQREIEGHLIDVEYFNGSFLQEVDPMTFEPLNGWYAKDKNNVYYYRPVSGGMQISKIASADRKTFAILKGHYKYGFDKNHYYDETEIIENFIPSKTNLKLDKKGRVFEMNCNKRNYKFEIVN